MGARDTSTGGIAILFASIVTLSVVVANTKTHFAAIVAEATASQNRRTDTVVLPKARVTIAPHTFDRTPIGAARSLGSVDELQVVSPLQLRIRGWIATPDRQLAKRVIAIVDNRTRFDISNGYGAFRPDVSTALNQSVLVNSGLDATISLASIGPGRHNVTLATVSSDGMSLEPLTTGGSIVLK